MNKKKRENSIYTNNRLVKIFSYQITLQIYFLGTFYVTESDKNKKQKKERIINDNYKLL